MARPIKNNANYFAHENNMRNDKKIKALRTKFGNEGYAIYCMMLETLTEANCLLIKLNIIEIEMLSGDFNIESYQLENIINYCIKINLFQKQKGYLYCSQLDNRMIGLFKKRGRQINSLRRKNYSLCKKNRVNASKTRVKGSQNPQSKVKESKIEKKTILSFNSFWDIYKKKKGITNCKKKWKTISEKDRKEIKKFVPLYVKYTPDLQFRKLPITFLNQKTWKDDIKEHKPKNINPDDDYKAPKVIVRKGK